MVREFTVDVEVANARVTEDFHIDAGLSCRLAESGNPLGRCEVIRLSGVQLNPQTGANRDGKVYRGVQKKNARGGGTLGPEIGHDACPHGHTSQYGLIRHTSKSLPSMLHHRCPTDPLDQVNTDHESVPYGGGQNVLAPGIQPRRDVCRTSVVILHKPDHSVQANTPEKRGRLPTTLTHSHRTDRPPPPTSVGVLMAVRQ